MKRFNPFNFEEIDNGKDYIAPQGRLLVRASQAVAVYVTVAGYEALAGVGTEVDVQIAQEFSYRVEMTGKGRMFVYTPSPINYAPAGEVFTNVDRQPMESGSLLEVKKALRQHTIEQRTLLAEMRNEARALRKAKEPTPAPAPEPQADPAPTPAPEPTPTDGE